MKIHSDKITLADITDARQSAGPGVYFLDHAPPVAAGSRKRATAWTFRLESDGRPDVDGTPRRYRTNAGTSHTADRFARPHAASWADWGRFLAHLFAVDPDAVTDYYSSAADFHAQTVGRFLPAADADLVSSVNTATDAHRYAGLTR